MLLKLISKEKNMNSELALIKIARIMVKQENNLLRLYNNKIKLDHIEISKYYLKGYKIKS